MKKLADKKRSDENVFPIDMEHLCKKKESHLKSFSHQNVLHEIRPRRMKKPCKLDGEKGASEKKTYIERETKELRDWKG